MGFGGDLPRGLASNGHGSEPAHPALASSSAACPQQSRRMSEGNGKCLQVAELMQVAKAQTILNGQTDGQHEIDQGRVDKPDPADADQVSQPALNGEPGVQAIPCADVVEGG